MAKIYLYYLVTIQIADGTEAEQTLLRANVAEALANAAPNSASPDTKVNEVEEWNG